MKRAAQRPLKKVIAMLVLGNIVFVLSYNEEKLQHRNSITVNEYCHLLRLNTQHTTIIGTDAMMAMAIAQGMG